MKIVLCEKPKRGAACAVSGVDEGAQDGDGSGKNEITNYELTVLGGSSIRNS
jgi:hypothetical protein